MKALSHLDDESRRRAILTTQKVRSEIALGETPWSESEQRITVALIKFLVTGTPSKLLVRKIKHVIADELPLTHDHDEAMTVVGYVETDEYVGLRLWQQALIERSFKQACDSANASLNSSPS